MRMTIVTLLLAAMSTSAMAEWVKIGNSDDSDIYVDPETIRKDGNMVKMWDIMDFKEPQVAPFATFSSWKSQAEYDCSNKRVRSLLMFFFSGRMGAGKEVDRTSSSSDWVPVAPRTGAENLWLVACSKVKLK